MKTRKILTAGILFSILSSIVVGNIVVKANEIIDTTNYSIVVDTKYVEKAVVSDTKIALKGDVRDENNMKLYDQNVIFVVESGSCVSISNNQLSINDSGLFSIRAYMENDPNIFTIVECEALDLTFSNLKIKNTFDNITVYTQPISLQSQIDVEGTRKILEEYKEVCYEVVSGPASIYCNNYLKIEGTGNVIIKAYSFYDSNVYDTLDFNVTDPDENLNEYQSVKDALK